MLVLGRSRSRRSTGSRSAIGGARLRALRAAVAVARAAVRGDPPLPTGLPRRYVEQFLPQAFGLTGDGRLPVDGLPARRRAHCSCARSSRDVPGAAAAGLGGRRRGRHQAGERALPCRRGARCPPGAPCGAPYCRSPLALAPALLTLALWKQRGLGAIPVFALEEVRTRSRDHDRRDTLDLTATSVSTGTTSIGTWPVCASTSTARASSSGLPFAGRSRSRDAPSPHRRARAAGSPPSYCQGDDAALDRVEREASSVYLMPAFPAYFLLAASMLLLGPRRRRPLAPRSASPPSHRHGLHGVDRSQHGLAAHVPPARRRRPPTASVEASEKAMLVNTILTPVDERDPRSTVTRGGARRERVTWSTTRDFAPRLLQGLPHRVPKARTSSASTAARPGVPSCRWCSLATTREAATRPLAARGRALPDRHRATNWQQRSRRRRRVL